ncbi:glycosyl transferase [Dubosiella muris]|uniref:Glycosyl transferase n=1 Tax=Dubosiella muris TaxID=3038133 RepID=A0AC61R7G2_9FIRM|nr:glycosyl transferase [Dubosiella muris]
MKNKMIPKIIHYCWFGENPLPQEAISCLKSWKEKCPNYKIVKWDETNFNISQCKYIEEAYRQKKWAFVSDYARFYILYKYGGVYLDTDVELIKSLDEILDKGPFLGCEEGEPLKVAPGLGMGVEAGNSLYKEVLDYYDKQSFIKENGKENLETIVDKTTKILKRKGFEGSGKIENISGISIYPPEFFCPKNYYTGELNITENTVSIHHYSASWYEKEEQIILKIKQKCKNIFGNKAGQIISLPAHYILRFKLRIRKNGGIIKAIKSYIS